MELAAALRPSPRHRATRTYSGPTVLRSRSPSSAAKKWICASPSALPDLLSYSTGVAFSRTGANGGTASLFLNGGNSNFVKVLVDGSAINPPGGAVDFSILTADNLDKIEIVRGAESATLWHRRRLWRRPAFLSSRHNHRSRVLHFFRGRKLFLRAVAVGRLSGLLGNFRLFRAPLPISRPKANTPTLISSTARSPATSATASATPTNSGSPSETMTRTPALPGQTVFTPPSLHQRYNQELFTANARWDFATGTHWQHQLMGAESYTRQHSFNPEQSFYINGPDSFCPQTSPAAVATTQFCDYLFDSRYQYNRASINAQTTYSIRKFAATAGYQYEVENASIYFLQQPHVRRNNQAGFLDFRYSPISRLSLDFGVRVEGNDYFGTRAVPRVGGNYPSSPGHWKLLAIPGFGLSMGRESKSLDSIKLMAPILAIPGIFRSNPNPARIGVLALIRNSSGDRIKVGADYFSNRFYDIVSFAFCLPDSPCPVTPPPGCTFGYGNYFNTDLARARGTNIDVEVRATKWLFVRGNYTYDDTLVIQSPNAFDPALLPGNRLAPPASKFRLRHVQRHISSDFNATFAGYFVGERTDSDFLNLGLTRNPGYARFDISTSYNFYRGLSVYARATNLFDKTYQDALGYPALGRDARIGLRYQFCRSQLIPWPCLSSFAWSGGKDSAMALHSSSARSPIPSVSLLTTVTEGLRTHQHAWRSP